jgi:hypothetical protein
MARNHTRIGSLVPCRTVPAISEVWVAAVPALQQLTLADLAIRCGCAPRTLEALGPAPRKPRLTTGLLVRIKPLEGIIREALLVLHALARHRFNPENLSDFRKIIPQYPAECRW